MKRSWYVHANGHGKRNDLLYSNTHLRLGSNGGKSLRYVHVYASKRITELYTFILMIKLINKLIVAHIIKKFKKT
jgi:hypothetical protein